MQANVEYLSCGEVETLVYFQSSDMRYDDRNVVTKRVSTTVLKLLNLNTCSNFRTRYRVPEADLRLQRLLRESSL